MTKKKPPPESSKDQSERFMADAQNMINAGELNPIEADKALEAALRNFQKKP